MSNNRDPDDLPEWDDLPVGICPNCEVASLRPIEDPVSEMLRQVSTGRQTELWACACGYTEEREPGSQDLP